MSARIWGAIALALVLVALSVGVAHADLIFRDEAGNTVIATDKQCTDVDVLVHIPPQYHGQFGQGRATVAGKPFSACYMPRGDGSVLIIFSDGEMAVLPMSAFKKASES